jgi:hypothetical protein
LSKMICAFCGAKHAETSYVVPEEAPEKVYDSAFACEDCFFTKGCWCTEHQQQRMGFYRRGIACLDCIATLARTLVDQYAHCIERDIRSRIPDEGDWYAVNMAAEVSAMGGALILTGEPEDIVDAPLFDGLANLAATAMILNNWTYEQLLEEIAAGGVDSLMGPPNPHPLA